MRERKKEEREITIPACTTDKISSLNMIAFPQLSFHPSIIKYSVDVYTVLKTK